MTPVTSLPMNMGFGKRTSHHKHLANGESLDVPRTASPQQTSRSSTPNPSHSRSSSRAHSPSSQQPTTELAARAAIMEARLQTIKTLFSLEVALNLVQMAKTSIDRASAFAQSDSPFRADAKNQCEAIFILLLKTLGDRHVGGGFDQAIEHLSNYDPRASRERQDQPGVAPLVVFLELVNVGDLIQGIVNIFYNEELVASHISDPNDFLSPTLKAKKAFEKMLDDRVAAGLNKGIEVLMTEIEYICATTQKVEDFNPGATGTLISSLVDVSPSNTAVWVVETVRTHVKLLVGSTDKNTLDVFNQEVGLRLFATLCKHLKRQRISVAGSVRLIRWVVAGLRAPPTPQPLESQTERPNTKTTRSRTRTKEKK